MKSISTFYQVSFETSTTKVKEIVEVSSRISDDIVAFTQGIDYSSPRSLYQLAKSQWKQNDNEVDYEDVWFDVQHQPYFVISEFDDSGSRIKDRHYVSGITSDGRLKNATRYACAEVDMSAGIITANWSDTINRLANISRWIDDRDLKVWLTYENWKVPA